VSSPSTSTPTHSPAQFLTRHPWLAYIAPFALFMSFTVIQPSDAFWPWLYPLKTVAVGIALLLLIRWFPKLEICSTWFAGGVGAVVFVLWVLPEGFYPLIMEELFWRGFLIRWLVKENFQKVAIGTFTWPSFLITSVLFASEHNRWLVGLMAGVVYNLVLYRTKSLYACMIAHGVTNLALAIFVLTTDQWAFW
jgi:hypothetical protein